MICMLIIDRSLLQPSSRKLKRLWSVSMLMHHTRLKASEANIFKFSTKFERDRHDLQVQTDSCQPSTLTILATNISFLRGRYKGLVGHFLVLYRLSISVNKIFSFLLFGAPFHLNRYFEIHHHQRITSRDGMTCCCFDTSERNSSLSDREIKLIGR